MVLGGFGKWGMDLVVEKAKKKTSKKDHKWPLYTTYMLYYKASPCNTIEREGKYIYKILVFLKKNIAIEFQVIPPNELWTVSNLTWPLFSDYNLPT